jgi:chitinase
MTAFITTNPRMPWYIAQLLNQDYSTWAIGYNSATGTPINRIFSTLGSKINPHPLVNAEAHLNSMKGRVCDDLSPFFPLLCLKLKRFKQTPDL